MNTEEKIKMLSYLKAKAEFIRNELLYNKNLGGNLTLGMCDIISIIEKLTEEIINELPESKIIKVKKTTIVESGEEKEIPTNLSDKSSKNKNIIILNISPYSYLNVKVKKKDKKTIFIAKNYIPEYLLSKAQNERTFMNPDESYITPSGIYKLEKGRTLGIVHKRENKKK